MNAPEYLHLSPGQPPPELNRDGPFKAIVVIESTVTPQWQDRVSDWLVRSGCRYMMAWGPGCSDWDDSVDAVSGAQLNGQEIPEDDFVVTTWHADEELQDVFRFCDRDAAHPSLDLARTVIVHIAPEARQKALLSAFRTAQRPAL